MRVTVRLVGSLRGISGKGKIILKMANTALLTTALEELAETCPKLEQALADPKSNTLILINGKEISVLKGLETALNDGDEVVLAPVLHGG